MLPWVRSDITSFTSLMQLDSLALAALRPMKEFVQVQLDKRAITAGRRRKAAAMVVGLWSFFYSSSKLINRYPFPGRHCGGDPAVKEELKSPGNSVPSKQRIYLTTDAKTIRCMDSMDVLEEGSSKRQNSVLGGPLTSTSMAWSSINLKPLHGPLGSRHGPPGPTQRRG